MTALARSIGRSPALIQVLSVLAAFAVGLVLIVMTGASLPQSVTAFAQGAFGSSYAISVSINRAVVFALVGLGFIIAARAGLTNVGGEGQIAVGGIAATATALFGGAAGLPGPLAFLYPMLAACCAEAVALRCTASALPHTSGSALAPVSQARKRPEAAS